VVTLLVLRLGSLRDPKVFPPDDFVEYWAAGRLNLEGKNPYDANLLKELQGPAGREEEFGVMMWNPPWTLTFVMPFGAIHPYDSKLLWFLQNILLMLLSSYWLWKIYDGPKELLAVPFVLAFTFIPTLLVLGAGQIGPMILLGITIFLWMEKAGYPWLAGLGGVLMAIKPHLVYLFWPTLAFLAFFRGRTIILGGILGGIICTAIPLVFNPQVLQQFWAELTGNPPAQWKSPTLGTVIRIMEAKLRGIDERDAFSLQFIPTLFGFLWLLGWGWTIRKQPWVWRERMPMLLLVSFFTTSYGAWPFDLVILLPVVISLAVKVVCSGDRSLIRLAIILWLILNGLAVMQNVLLKAYSFWYLWMAPLMIVFHSILSRKLSESASTQPPESRRRRENS
jgi:hypothetical protein